MFSKTLRRIKEVWLDITNQTDDRGFTKAMRQAKRKLDKLHKQNENNTKKNNK